VLSNGHAGFGGRSGETHQRKRRQGAPGRPNVAAGKTPMEAMRALKRRLSDIVYHQMVLDARAAAAGPGGHTGAATGSSAAGLHPSTGTSEKSLPGPAAHDPTPGKPSPFPWPLPAPSNTAGPQPSSSALCLTTARTGAHYSGRE
jgi:hypothetical protein